MLAVNALLAFGALALAFAEPRRGPELQLVSGSGSLSLSNSREGEAIFSAAGLRPGSQVAGTVRLTNTGSVPGALRLAQTAAPVDAPGVGGGRLSERLELGVVDVTGARVAVYGGRLSAMPAVALGTIAPGEERSYRFVATLPPAADNAYQGAALAAAFTWTAVGGAIETPTPAPAPAPAPTPTPVPPQSGTLAGEGGLPVRPAWQCASRRTFPVRVRRPRGVRFTSLRVTVGKRVKVKRTGLGRRRIKVRVNLRGLPKGAFSVKIVARTTTGRRLVSRRTYRTCAAKTRARRGG